MIPVHDARRILSEVKVYPATETVNLAGACNRILAGEILATVNMPPFDKSAMDGYAVSSADDSDRFEIIEVIPAGRVPVKRIRKGSCAKIMTGAMLPEGADRVIKREVTRSENGFMTVIEDDPADNICYRGEDVRIGTCLLKSGDRLNPADIGIIASMGIDRLEVFMRPKIGLLVTGEEIIEPGKILESGQIFNSNAYSLSAQLMSLGLDVYYRGIVSDSRKAIREKIKKLQKSSDIILVSGGVSVGDFDYVPGILEAAGFELLFQKISIKPGKPTVFGRQGKRFVFGMPGNPVSTFVVFEALVKPFLYRMMGHDFIQPLVKGTLLQGFNRSKASRTAFIPVRYQNGMVEILEYHGSAHIYAFSKANGLLEIPAGVKEIKMGAEVDVRSL
jgi:molybdopterin molybdotransferase